MDLHFLGGATTVTGSQFLLETGRARVLIDCGMFQGSPNEAMRNRVPFGFDPATSTSLLLTHAHLDHCGLIPHLVNEGYRGRIVATRRHGRAGRARPARQRQAPAGVREARGPLGAKHPDKAEADDRKERDAYQAAVDLAEGRIRSSRRARRGDAPQSATSRRSRRRRDDDLGRRSEEAAAATTRLRPIDMEADLRGQPPEVEIDLDEPLYTADDAKAAVEHFDTVDVRRGARGRAGRPRDLPRRRPHPRLGDHPPPDRGRRRVGRRAGPDARPRSSSRATSAGPARRSSATRPILRDADYLLVESTYGGREHEPEDEAIRILAETVRMVSEAGGVLLVPSFAIGRTQEIVYQLDRLLERGQDPGAAAVPRLADGLEGLRHLPPPRRVLRRARPRRSSSTARRRSTTRIRP